MQLHLTKEEIKIAVQSLSLYATTCRSDAQAAPTPEYAAHLNGYAVAAEDLAERLHTKSKMKPRKSESHDKSCVEVEPIDPYSEWAPNDPRNW